MNMPTLEDLEPPIPPDTPPQPPGFGAGQDALANYHAQSTSWRSLCAIYENEVRAWRRKMARFLTEMEAMTGQVIQHNQVVMQPSASAPQQPIPQPMLTHPVSYAALPPPTENITTPVQATEQDDRANRMAILSAAATAWMQMPHHEAGDLFWHGGKEPFEWDGVPMDAPTFLTHATEQALS